ncbi:MAG: hypothetical protein ACREE0_07020 [Phenylobacterium sp.]
MTGKLWAALAVAAVTFGAAQAQATIVQATASGSYTGAGGPADLITRAPCFNQAQCFISGNRLTISSSSSLGAWYTSFNFDTDFGVLTQDAFSQTLTWNTGMGTPSPLTGGSLLVTGPVSAAQDFSTATSFSIRRDAGGFSFHVTGADYNVFAGYDNLGAPTPGPYSLTAPFAGSTGVDLQNPQFTYANSSYAIYSLYEQAGSLTPGPIPEPSSWALMISGFLAVGAVLRQGRSKSRRGLARA